MLTNTTKRCIIISEIKERAWFRCTMKNSFSARRSLAFATDFQPLRRTGLAQRSVRCFVMRKRKANVPQSFSVSAAQSPKRRYGVLTPQSPKGLTFGAASAKAILLKIRVQVFLPQCVLISACVPRGKCPEIILTWVTAGRTVYGLTVYRPERKRPCYR